MAQHSVHSNTHKQKNKVLHHNSGIASKGTPEKKIFDIHRKGKRGGENRNGKGTIVLKAAK
jgi:hypothetical protein